MKRVFELEILPMREFEKGLEKGVIFEINAQSDYDVFLNEVETHFNAFGESFQIMDGCNLPELLLNCELDEVTFTDIITAAELLEDDKYYSIDVLNDWIDLGGSILDFEDAYTGYVDIDDFCREYYKTDSLCNSQLSDYIDWIEVERDLHNDNIIIVGESGYIFKGCNY